MTPIFDDLVATTSGAVHASEEAIVNTLSGADLISARRPSPTIADHPGPRKLVRLGPGWSCVVGVNPTPTLPFVPASCAPALVLARLPRLWDRLRLRQGREYAWTIADHHGPPRAKKNGPGWSCVVASS